MAYSPHLAGCYRLGPIKPGHDPKENYVMTMQVSLSFDPTDENQVAKASSIIAGMSGGAVVTNVANVSEVSTTIETPDAGDETPPEETAKERTARLRKEKAAQKKKDEEQAAAEAEEAEKNKPEIVASRDDVRKALKDYASLEGKDAAIKIIKGHGATSISDLAEDQFDLVVAACE